jgi:beta-phosphoglucomutase-like phosphatase (HAD superfamily)
MGSHEALARIFARLGARDPEAWARSQVEEGIPQLARFLFLRQAWAEVVEDGDTAWIDAWIEEARGAPDAPFAGVGAALERLRASGARDGDLTELVRGMQAQLLFALCHLLDGPGPVEPEAGGVLWALVQVNEEGEVLGHVAGLHESVLETDPTGREMRPR